MWDEPHLRTDSGHLAESTGMAATEQVLPPEQIETPTELGVALRHLTGRAGRALAKRLESLVMRDDASWKKQKIDHPRIPRPSYPATSPSVAATWLNGSNPPTHLEMHFLLRSRGNHPDGRTVDDTLLDRWTEACDRVRRNQTTGPPGDTRRVSAITDHDALTRLGVAHPIELPGIDPHTLPTHITRDQDPALAHRVQAAAQNGGFIVLRGSSGAGKSYAALHAIRNILGDTDSTLGDWWLLNPTHPNDIHHLAQHPVPHTILWLDELAAHLDHTDLAQLRDDLSRLLRHRHPILIIGSIWNENYDRLTQPPPPAGQPDPHHHTRALLHLANDPIDINPHFSDAELAHANQAAATDPRIATVIRENEPSNRPTPTQDLAGHQYILQRWEQALTAHNNNDTSPAAYGYAILAATVDAHRLGHYTPIPRQLLQHAASGYLTPDQIASAPKKWLTKAISYATHPYRGHQPLQPHPGSKPRQTIGYLPTDPLQQLLRQGRSRKLVPESLWNGLVTIDLSDGDASRLGRAAYYRNLDEYSRTLLSKVAGTDTVVSRDETLTRSRLSILANRRPDFWVPWAPGVTPEAHSSARFSEIIQYLDPYDRNSPDHIRKDALLDIAIETFEPNRWPDFVKQYGTAEVALREIERDFSMLFEPLSAAISTGVQYGSVTAVDELRSMADSGDHHAADALAWCLAVDRDFDALRKERNAAITPAASYLLLLSMCGSSPSLVDRGLNVAGTDLGEESATAR